MQHHAGAHARADVGGTGGQVAELLAEGVADPLLEQVVHAVDVLPCLVEGEAAAHHLEAEVVFLVDHQADGFLGSEGDAARPLGGGQLAADELPFHQQLPVQRRQPHDVEVAEHRIELQLADALAQHALDLRLLVRRGSVGEWERG